MKEDTGQGWQEDQSKKNGGHEARHSVQIISDTKNKPDQ